MSRRLPQDEIPEMVVDQHQLEYPLAPAVARAATAVASTAAVEGHRLQVHCQIQAAERVHRWSIRFLAFRADDPYQALGNHSDHRGGDQERLDPHLDKTRHRRRCIVRVQGAEHQMARERGLSGNECGL